MRKSHAYTLIALVLVLSACAFQYYYVQQLDEPCLGTGTHPFECAALAEYRECLGLRHSPTCTDRFHAKLRELYLGGITIKSYPPETTPGFPER